MTTPDLDKLLSLAEAALSNGPGWCDSLECDDYDPKDAALITACSPTTIKALVEELKYQTERADTWMSIADGRLDEIKELHKRLEHP